MGQSLADDTADCTAADPVAPRCPRSSVTTAGPVSWAVFSLARAHRNRAAVLLRELGLHPGQELLLAQLLDRDGQTQSELLDAVGLDHSTVSKSLSRMQEAGLLTREPTPQDRRVLRVLLTDAGRAMRGPLAQMWATLEEATTHDLSPAEAQAFVDAAARIEQSILTRCRPAGVGLAERVGR